MRERDVERILTQGIRKAGGAAYKFVSPGNDGVPDRLVVMPGGRICFVELKQDTGELSGLQKIQIGRMRRLGCNVRVLYGAEDVRNFLREVRDDKTGRGENT